MVKTLRVLYAAGPGDVIGTYRNWVEGHDDPSQVSITYSGQFYEVCRALDAQVYVISSSAQRKFLCDGQFTIEHRPIPFRSSFGLLYHLGQLWDGLRLIASAVRFRSDIAVVADGTTHWFVLSLLPWLGIQVIPSLHCVLWRKYLPKRRGENLILQLSRNFFARDCTAILAVSDEIGEQVYLLTEGQHRPILRTFPVYRRSEFVGIDEPDAKRSPFRVLFVGRIERDKGVFDLLEVAKRFAAEDRRDITFDLCGDGSVIESLRLAATQARIDSSFVCHGYCNKPQMRQMYSLSHVVIVPTRAEFVEGFNKVVVEGILAGRPVVASSVCTDLSYLRAAIVESPPDDIKAYGDALLKLYDDREFYKEKQRSCRGLQEQYYDDSSSWGAALKSILVAIQTSNKRNEAVDLLVNQQRSVSTQS